MRLSKFVRAFSYNDDILLYNSYNKSLVKILGQFYENNKIVDDFPDDYRDALNSLGFFLSEHEANHLIEQAMKKDKKLMISVEVSLSCNMRCPYCYQGQVKTSSDRLSDEDIKYLIEYCKKVLSVWDYEEVVLKVLGGEPTANWNTTKKVIDSVYNFCKSYHKKMQLMIDTNGVLIDDILNCSSYDSLLLTIPLTYELCHNKIRQLSGGKGTYDIIRDNIQKLHSYKPNAVIVIRHNTDNENIYYFDEFLRDLKKHLDFNPIIDLSYTTELGDGDFKNGLAYTDYIEWKSTEAIDLLLKNKCYIVATPLMSTDRCQHRSVYSMKVFSDGTVGSCAMWFFSNRRIPLKDLSTNIDLIKQMKDMDTQEYQKCSSCDSFFLCGGGYNLPCIRSLKLENCLRNGDYIINLEAFLKRYYDCESNNSLKELFIGFNNKALIR